RRFRSSDAAGTGGIVPDAVETGTPCRPPPSAGALESAEITETVPISAPPTNQWSSGRRGRVFGETHADAVPRAVALIGGGAQLLEHPQRHAQRDLGLGRDDDFGTRFCQRARLR